MVPSSSPPLARVCAERQGGGRNDTNWRSRWTTVRGGASVKRQVFTAVFIWLVLTAAGEIAVFANMFPTVGSHEAADFDKIFRILMAMSIPVMAFVFAMLGAVMTGFRTKGQPTEDGPAIYGRGMIPRLWLVVTGALAVAVMILGLASLATLQKGPSDQAGWGDPEAEMVVRVTGARWYWVFEFPDAGVELIGSGEGKEIKLPVDTKIKFEINALDVIHSLWVPAFRMRIDAVPGHQTYFTTEPTKLGYYESDHAYRFQCSMLCGLDHSAMWNPIQVVPRDEFQAWLAEKKDAVKR